MNKAMCLEDEQIGSPIIDDLQAMLDQARDILFEKAKTCADNFWVNHLQLDKAKGSGRPSSLGCRVRQKGDGVYAEWYYNKWRRRADGSSQPFSHHIRRSQRSFQYDLKKLYAHAPQWEHQMIRKTEVAFGNLRQQNSQLATMRRSLQALSKLESEWAALISAGDEDDQRGD
jgi:hypothetical protein